MGDAPPRDVSREGADEPFPMVARFESFVKELAEAPVIEQAYVLGRAENWLTSAKRDLAQQRFQSLRSETGTGAMGAARAWPDDDREFARQVKDEIIRYLGASGGRSSITSILEHLQAVGAKNVNRSSLTQTLNRMCTLSKTTGLTLLKRTPRARGEYELDDDGHNRSAELVGRK